MQIFVRADRTYTLDVESLDSVAHAKSLINAKTGFPAPSQRLIYSGLQLVDSRTLAVSRADDDGLVDYNISQDATVQLVFSLEGGAKKRKKKQYTTPKKIKHKHKKEKMATLKYYSVDSDGKIQRLRRECPSETCGAGIFMAFHKDRQYCGKCHTTYKLDKDDDE